MVSLYHVCVSLWLCLPNRCVLLLSQNCQISLFYVYSQIGPLRQPLLTPRVHNSDIRSKGCRQDSVHTCERTDRQMERQTAMQTDKQTDGQTFSYANGQTDRRTDKQQCEWTNTQTDRQTTRRTEFVNFNIDAPLALSLSRRSCGMQRTLI